MATDDFYWDLAELNPDAVVFDEFKEAYLGYADRNGLKPVAIYSYDYIINIIATNIIESEDFAKRMEEDNITEEAEQVATAIDEAAEYFDYNVAGVGKGDNNEDGPIFLRVPQWDSRGEDEDD